MDTMTQPLDLRQHPRLRIPAPFACSFQRRGLTKWIRGNHEGLGVVFDVSIKGAKVMSETGIEPGERMSVSPSGAVELARMNGSWPICATM